MSDVKTTYYQRNKAQVLAKLSAARWRKTPRVQMAHCGAWWAVKSTTWACPICGKEVL
jgi:rubrerythrin